MSDSGWQYPGGDPPGPYGGAPPPSPPTPPPAPGPPGSPPQPPAGPWSGAPGAPGDPASVPWQQPQYGAGPPSPPGKRWPMIALFGAVVLLVVAIIGVAVTSGGDDGDDTATGTDDTDEPTESTEPGDPDDTEPAEPDEPEGPSDPGAFVDDEGGYAISLPDTWAFTALHGDLSSAGAEMFPDDPAKADLVQQAVGTLPRAIIFYGVVAEEVGSDPFVTNVNINSTSTPGAGELSYDEFATEVRNGIDMIGATVTGDEPFTLAGAEGIRVEFDYDPSLGASGVQYSAIIDEELWVVNFASADVATHEAEFDEIASSFELLG